MTRRVFLSLLVFSLLSLSGGAPPALAQSCTDASCAAGEVCCPHPPVGAVSSCMSAKQCASINPSFRVQEEKKEDRLVNLLTVDSVEELVTVILDLMVQVGSILLILALVLSGFRFVSAQGNPEAVTQAKKSLMWVVIGGLLLLGAEALSLVIKSAVESL